MKIFSTLSLFVVLALQGFSQATLPALFSLSSGTYTMNAWDSLSAAGSSPANMKFHFTIMPESTTGDGYDSSAEGARDYDCVFDLTSRNRILGLNANGFAFQATSSAQYNDCSGTLTTADANRYVGVAVVGINATGKSNIGVKWIGTIKTLGDGNGDTTVRRQYTTRLQYRIGATGNYSDVIVGGKPAEFSSLNADFVGASASVSAALPAGCNNQPVLYVRWVYFENAVGSGTRPEIAVDDIQIGAGILPVNLLSFSAVLNNYEVSLTWKTVDEINFSKFEIEKSTDAVSFSTIGNVEGINTPGVHNYNFSDPKLISGNSYYRLKMINKDGSSSYSGVLRIFNTKATAINIYPNPVSTNLLLTHPQALAGAVFQIISFDGKKVGSYTAQPNAIETSIDVSKLVKGNYFVIYNNGKTTMTAKFIKQ
jgi:hypothetical protein